MRQSRSCAEHFRLIGEGTGLVEDRVWANVPSYSPMDAVWGNAPAPNELHAAFRQMSLEKAAGEVVRVCREQWLLLTEAAPGAEVVWLDEWKRKGNRQDKNI